MGISNPEKESSVDDGGQGSGAKKVTRTHVQLVLEKKLLKYGLSQIV